jgi:hypothetical protein
MDGKCKLCKGKGYLDPVFISGGQRTCDDCGGTGKSPVPTIPRAVIDRILARLDERGSSEYTKYKAEHLGSYHEGKSDAFDEAERIVREEANQ